MFGLLNTGIKDMNIYFFNLETLKLTDSKTFPQNIKDYDCIYNASKQLAHVLYFLIGIGGETFKDTQRIRVQLT